MCGVCSTHLCMFTIRFTTSNGPLKFFIFGISLAPNHFLGLIDFDLFVLQQILALIDGRI